MNMDPFTRQNLVRLAYLALCVKGRSRKAVRESLVKHDAMVGLTPQDREKLAKEIISEALYE